MLNKRMESFDEFPIYRQRKKKEKIEFGFIYFLLYKKTIVYIGQAKDMANRILNHNSSKKVYDEVRYYKIQGNLLNQAELEEINRYCPLYNIKSLSRKSLEKRPDYLIFGNELITRDWGNFDIKEIYKDKYLIYKKLYNNKCSIHLLKILGMDKIQILKEEFPTEKTIEEFQKYAEILEF